MKEYLQTFPNTAFAMDHAKEYSKRENRPELSSQDSVDLYVIQSKDIIYVSSSGYAGIYDYILAHYADGIQIKE
jgi:hypothetical protein